MRANYLCQIHVMSLCPIKARKVLSSISTIFIFYYNTVCNYKYHKIVACFAQMRPPLSSLIASWGAIGSCERSTFSVRKRCQTRRIVSFIAHGKFSAKEKVVLLNGQRTNFMDDCNSRATQLNEQSVNEEKRTIVRFSEWLSCDCSQILLK